MIIFSWERREEVGQQHSVPCDVLCFVFQQREALLTNALCYVEQVWHLLHAMNAPCKVCNVTVCDLAMLFDTCVRAFTH